MSVTRSLAATLLALALLGLTSCAGPAVTTAASTGTPTFYWSAAQETYAAGDYIKTADHLEHLIDGRNEYKDQAIPWYLVLTSGITAGYMEVADSYSMGAHINKKSALDFYRRASDFRTIASRYALRFGQNIDKLNQIPLGIVRLPFGLPKGNPAPPAELAKITRGIELAPGDVETAQLLNIQRNVLLTVCRAAGAPNDLAKTEEILGRPSASVSRVTFAGAVAAELDREATLYARDKLDEPEKLAIFRRLAQNALQEGAKSGSARFVPIGSLSQ